MSRAVPPDAIGYPGKPGKPTPVDPETANLWRSLGIHIPPQTLRDSRENHERSLHKILTAIAIKLEKLSRSSAESGGAMARQDEVNAEFAKVRKEMSIMDTKALSAARAAGQSAVAALTEKVTRTDQKLKLLTTQSTTMRRELSEVKHILAEEDAADAALDNNDVDYLEMSKDEDAVKEMYAQVTEQADRAEQKMMEVLLEQQSKNAELSAMRAEMSGANARSQDLFQRQSAGQADREARLQEEIRKMQSEMSSGGDQMAALQQEQAAAMAEAEASATQRMLDLHAKLDAEQEQLKASMSGDSKESAEAMEKQIAALNAKMKEEAAALDKARNQVSAAAERKQAKLREEMDQQQAAMRAKMASLESQSIMDAAAAEAKTASLLDQLQKEQAEMAAKDDGKKTEAQKEAEKRNAAEIDRLQSMISDQANQAPIATGTPEEMQKIFEQLEAERAKLDSMQQSHAVAEGDMEKGLTSEMKRLQKQLEAAQKESADGSEGAASRAESLAAELQGQQAEAEKRAAHEKMIREAEQAAIMQQMARLQSALESERDKTLTLEQQQEVDAAAKAQNELAASMATLQEDLAASKQKMESMEANGDTQGSEQAAQARSANEALEAKLAAEQARMKEMETAAASAQANMMSGMEETQRRAAQQMSDMEAQMRSQLGAIGDASAMAEAEQKALGASRTAARAAMGSRGAGKTRVQRKLEQKVEVEELRGRVGALTIKMGRLTKLLTMMDGADDIPGLLKILREQKADRSELKELEDRLVAAGVGGGASMGNALRQMEENITEHAAQIANIIVTKADVGDVNGAADRAKEDLMAELEKHAAQLAKLYAETTGRMDGLDEDKAERDWIEDLIAKIRRQVAGLKKKVNEGAVDGAMDGLSGMLSGQVIQMAYSCSSLHMQQCLLVTVS